MKNLLFIFGTRPEAIKMLPIINYAKNNYADRFIIKLCVTGQHRQMLDQVLELFAVSPDFDLNIMSPNQDLYDITSRVLLGMRSIINEVNPDCILVHGDTTTAMASSLVAFYQQIAIAHVEAGLRTHNIYNPWPEEINRSVIAKIATFHFAPTNSAKINLNKEGIFNNIFIVGNSGCDALSWVYNTISTNSELEYRLTCHYKKMNITFNKITILVTLHRRENLGNNLNNALKAIKQIAVDNSYIQIIYATHLNPNIKYLAEMHLSNVNNIFLIPPQDYQSFIFLMKKSQIVLTDSGSIQEEALQLNKDILILRDVSERKDSINNNQAILVGTNKTHIIESVDGLLKGKPYQQTIQQNSLNTISASKLILDHLANSL